MNTRTGVVPLTKNVMRSARVPHAQNADLKSAAGTHFAYQLLHHYRFVFCLTTASQQKADLIRATGRVPKKQSALIS